MMSDAEHLFTRLLFICTSSLEKDIFKSFAHFKRKLFAFLLFTFRSSIIYILNINPLSDI